MGERKLVPIDELIGREAVRRRLNLQDHYVDMMLYGYMKKRTFEDVRTPMALVSGNVANENDEDAETETSEETEKEGEWSRERMTLFGGETDEDDAEEIDEQEQESSSDEQGLAF